MATRPVPRHLAGDLARVLGESLRCVHGAVVLVTVTQPGEFDNATTATRWRKLNGRLRVVMDREHGLHPPRIVARVAQRQCRGADHLHCVYLARTQDERERMEVWVEAYREHAEDYRFGFVDDPFRLRRRRDGQMRDMLFERADAGGYLGQYMTGSQLERFSRPMTGAGSLCGSPPHCSTRRAGRWSVVSGSGRGGT